MSIVAVPKLWRIRNSRNSESENSPTKNFGGLDFLAM